MRIGVHAHSFLLAAGLRDFQPVGRGALSAAQLLEKAAHYKFHAVQLTRQNITSWEMIDLVALRQTAEDQSLTLHLSTDIFDGEHLADMIRAAHTMGATQVSVGLTHLMGSLQQRQRRLESMLDQLDIALKTAERYKIMLAIENGHHVAAADLAALIDAAGSDRIGVCFDMGNALTVPEHPVESADTLGRYCTSAHLKDWHAYRIDTGILLENCPVGEGVLEVVDVMRALKKHKPNLTVFLQTAAERYTVPLLEDEFLATYPRITARALAGALRRGSLNYSQDEMAFPHERKASEKEVLKWEDDRVKRSLKQAQKLLGAESLTLSLG